jgi:hypothetical protein
MMVGVTVAAPNATSSRGEMGRCHVDYEPVRVGRGSFGDMAQTLRRGSRDRHRRQSSGREAQTLPARPLLHRRRQEVRHGDHRHHDDRLRRRPHDRQPEDVQGPTPRTSTSTPTASSSATAVPAGCRSTHVLWLLRIGLIVALLLHVHAAYSLTVMNRKARPVKYQSARDYQIANFASRTMRWTGIIVLLFIALAPRRLHVGGWTNPDFVYGEVYATSTPACRGSRWASSTSSPTSPSASTCSTAPGASSSPRLEQPALQPVASWFATGFATVVVVGNVSFPIAVLAGIV